MKINVTYKM